MTLAPWLRELRAIKGFHPETEEHMWTGHARAALQGTKYSVEWMALVS